MIVKVTPSGCYTFKYELGETSTDIDFIDADNSAGDGVISVEASYDGRYHVLKFIETLGSVVDMDHTGFDITTTGAIELMHRWDAGVNSDNIFTLYDGANRLVRIYLDISEGDYSYDNGGGLTKICDLAGTEWHYISIRIDIAAGVNGQFDCYIYDKDYTELDNVTGIEFENNATTIDKLRIESEAAAGGSTFYLDCIGITAEGSYTQGDLQYVDVDLSSYMNDCRIYYGIFPYKNKFTFTCHPNHWSYFNVGDYVDIYNDDGVLLFAGWIKIKPQKVGDKYVCIGMGDEVFERTYDKSYTSDNTKEKLQDMTTNALKFCYEGTYDATATDWSYEFARACAYMFTLSRWMERQVVYIEPDGEIYVKDYDGLTKELQYYGGTYNFRDDTVGSIPSGWFFFEDSVGVPTAEVVLSYKGHKKVIQITHTGEAGKSTYLRAPIFHEASGTIEWLGLLKDNTGENWFYITGDAGTSIVVKMDNGGNIKYYKAHVATNAGAFDFDTWYHFKVIFDCTTDKYDFYINGVLIEADVDFYDLQTEIQYWRMQEDSTGVADIYADAIGFSWDTVYTVGDNYAAWSLGSHYQQVQLIDIPALREKTPGYYKGNTGITSVSVRYKDNTPVVRPATPVETFRNKRLPEFRDPKIRELATAQQIGDNLYAIFALDTIFLCLRGEGLGWLQPGKSLHIQGIRQITIAAAHFLLQRVIYDPKNDIHHQMILSNNIITPQEFKTEFDTSGQQIHTAMLQAAENQASTPHIWTSAAAPTIDETDGVKIGDVCMDTTNDDGYLCLDATDGAPVWKKTTP